MALRAALGFRLHTGWAAVVAAAWRPDEIEILLRRRIELLPTDGSIPRFVYHTAAEMTGDDPAPFIKRATAAAHKSARAEVQEIVDRLRGLEVSVESAGVPSSSARVPMELEKILAAHPAIHAAEGALFCGAVVAACESCGLGVVTVRERDLLIRAAEACGSNPTPFQKSLDGLRKSLGPPWSADHKLATAAALLALAARTQLR